MRCVAAFLLFMLAHGAFGACTETSIRKPVPFRGYQGEVVVLEDGSTWQVKSADRRLEIYFPAAIVCAESGKLIVDGKEMRAVRLDAGPAPVEPAPPRASPSLTPQAAAQRRAAYRQPAPVAVGGACNTDLDCPSAAKCTRNSTHETWYCAAR